MDPIVILGNGAAGVSAAETIRKFNDQISIAMVTQLDMPAYSPCALPDYLAGSVDKSRLFINSRDTYSRLGIETCFGYTVETIDSGSHKIITNRGQLTYQQLIIALGSLAIVPPVAGNTLPGNFSVKTLDDVDAILASRPHRVVVVGSGNIGIETAQALKSRGCQVTVVETMNRVLPKLFDQIPSLLIEARLRDKGITIYTDERVTQVAGDKQVEGVITGSRQIPCDAVIWSTGVRPNTGIARQAGIKLGDLGGIQVNSLMGTNFDGIYAAGDCVESKNLISGRTVISPQWPNAKRQGQIAALNCLGMGIEYEGSINLVTEDIGGWRAVSMGLIQEDIPDESVEILEKQSSDSYWRLLLADDVFVGMQALGVTSGPGAFWALLKKRCCRRDLLSILSEENFIRTTSWYLPTRQFLDQSVRGTI